MFHLLTIAGSDSSGGAGIQADLKTFAAHGCYGMSVITAVTAQNTTGVTAIQNIDPEVVEAQIDAVFQDIRVDGVKVGMVSNSALIRAIARKMEQYAPKVLVVDPVMVATSPGKGRPEGPAGKAAAPGYIDHSQYAGGGSAVRPFHPQPGRYGKGSSRYLSKRIPGRTPERGSFGGYRR